MTKSNYFNAINHAGLRTDSLGESRSTLALSDGDAVGLVLLTPGAPEAGEDVHAYLYSQYMDELGASTLAGCRLRAAYSRFMASRSLGPASDQIKAVGGGAALNLLTMDQASALESAVRKRFKSEKRIFIGSYVAARFGSLTALRAAERMRRDAVNKIVYVPIFPPYATDLCDFSSAYWKGFQKDGPLSALDTTWVSRSFSSLGFARATRDRIDEAFQRFPGPVRQKVHVLFVARWSGQSSWVGRSANVPAEVSETVAMIVNKCSREFTFSIAHVDSGRVRLRGKTSVRTQLGKLRSQNRRAVLVVPVDHVSEQLDSAYRIDVQLRTLALEYGFNHYHVSSNVNCHPAYINSLAAQITRRFKNSIDPQDEEERVSRSGSNVGSRVPAVGCPQYPA